jgi:hypothetical protein
MLGATILQLRALGCCRRSDLGHSIPGTLGLPAATFRDDAQNPVLAHHATDVEHVSVRQQMRTEETRETPPRPNATPGRFTLGAAIVCMPGDAPMTLTSAASRRPGGACRRRLGRPRQLEGMIDGALDEVPHVVGSERFVGWPGRIVHDVRRLSRPPPRDRAARRSDRERSGRGRRSGRGWLRRSA